MDREAASVPSLVLPPSRGFSPELDGSFGLKVYVAAVPVRITRRIESHQVALDWFGAGNLVADLETVDVFAWETVRSWRSLGPGRE